jgi:hypothetical protein
MLLWSQPCVTGRPCCHEGGSCWTDHVSALVLTEPDFDACASVCNQLCDDGSGCWTEHSSELVLAKPDYLAGLITAEITRQ